MQQHCCETLDSQFCQWIVGARFHKLTCPTRKRCPTRWCIDMQMPSSFSNSHVAHKMSPHICTESDTEYMGSPLCYNRIPQEGDQTSNSNWAKQCKIMQLMQHTHTRARATNFKFFNVWAGKGSEEIFAILFWRQEECNNTPDLLLIMCWWCFNVPFVTSTFNARARVSYKFTEFHITGQERRKAANAQN